ncbi:MAG: hypothetical protein ABSA06_09505 [Geobacteraceae bacterium]|jgi:hypothetical protein
MPGNIKEIIERIISEKEKDNKMLVAIIKAKLILKGIYLDRLTSASCEDPLIIARIEEVIKQI